ncbi:MAG TPA: S8 family serine peptidase [Hyphomonadaceae bacterium]|nr:S8 family serine peptidase [Hyphomonadaceae bacterium]
MTQRRWWTASAITLALSALAGCEPKSVAPAQPEPAPQPEQTAQPAQRAACPPPAFVPAESQLAVLTAKAEEQGSVRVIVRLNAQPAQASIRTAQSAAMKAFRDAGAEEVAVISPRLPYIVAEVSAQELAAMYSSPQFGEWSEDRIAYPTLAQSGPLVQAPQLWAAGGRGKGQAVAIVDTGVDRTHPFLAGRVAVEACFSTTSATSSATSVCPNGQSSQTGEGAGVPCKASGCDHGTHVAGIAAGKGADFSGIAPDADIIAIQVFSQFTGRSCGIGTQPCVASFTSDQIRALDFVLQQAGQRSIPAVNMSLGGGRSTQHCDFDLTKPVIDQLRAAGVATAIASGNDGFRESVSFPGCISTAVTVGATSKQDQLAEFSNCGPQVDLHAPGVSINSSVPGGGFASFNGTSMATPHVAGAFAALKSAHPAATIDQIEKALKDTGIDVGGRPRIRLLEASNALGGGSGQEVAVAQNPSPPSALQPVMTELAALPSDLPVRVIAGVGSGNAQPQSVADALARIETAARAYGAKKIERLGAQPLLAIECTAAQARDLAASGVVTSMQIDRAATTQ